MDREYIHAGALPDWLREFADRELQKEGNPFDDIRELFKSKNDVEAVEARVEELREMVGLNKVAEEENSPFVPISGESLEEKTDAEVFRELVNRVYDYARMLENWNLKYDQFPDFYKWVDENWPYYGKDVVKDFLHESAESRSRNYWGAGYSSDNYWYLRKRFQALVKDIEGDLSSGNDPFESQEEVKTAGKASKQFGYSGPIEDQTLKNKNYRKVLFTGKHSQLVLMTLKGGEEIGLETHKNIDQFFRVEEGEAIFVLNGKKKRIKKDEAIIVPSGTEHNVINASDTEPLKLYTIYSPPNHPPSTVQKNKPEEAKKKAQLMLDLIAFAQGLEDNGMLEKAALVDEKIKAMQNDPMLAKDDVNELPKKYNKYKGLDEFIQNACRTSGGFASVPAIQNRIRQEFDEDVDVKDDAFEKYIKHCLDKHKEDVPESDEHIGEYIAIIVTEDDDGNQKFFDEQNNDGIK